MQCRSAERAARESHRSNTQQELARGSSDIVESLYFGSESFTPSPKAIARNNTQSRDSILRFRWAIIRPRRWPGCAPGCGERMGIRGPPRRARAPARALARHRQKGASQARDRYGRWSFDGCCQGRLTERPLCGGAHIRPSLRACRIGFGRWRSRAAMPSKATGSSRRSLYRRSCGSHAGCDRVPAGHRVQPPDRTSASGPRSKGCNAPIRPLRSEFQLLVGPASGADVGGPPKTGRSTNTTSCPASARLDTPAGGDQRAIKSVTPHRASVKMKGGPSRAAE